MKPTYGLTLLLSVLLCACGGGGASSTPAASMYTVGGTVSGLTASSGVMLLDNGGNALAVAVNATTFMFTTPVASGSAYAVTVQTQPSGETCTVDSGSGIANANVTSVSVSCASNFAGGGANVVAFSVNPGPAQPTYQTFDIPLVSVTVCEPGTAVCATIPDVEIDTGSSGLRLMASVLAGAGVTLTPMPDPNTPGNTIQECVPYADGYTWGAVTRAKITIGGESAAAISVQVIDDSQPPSPAPPGSCSSQGGGNSLNSVNAFDANGILGVGVFAQDCGGYCVTDLSNDIYWTCTAGGSCTSTTLVLADQVANPVVSFPTDNNGVIVQLPSIPAAGSTTANGYLVFGIGTEANNGLGGATVLTADANGNFITTFESQALDNSFIDSGSNGLYFPNSTNPPFTLCGSFYCPPNNPPSSPLSLSAVNQGQNGTMSTVSFQIVDLDDISTSNFAIDDVGGLSSSTAALTNYFDWGVPFFYGRTVFTAIEGLSAGGTVGPYYAY